MTNGTTALIMSMSECSQCRSDGLDLCLCGWQDRHLARIRDKERERKISIRIGISAAFVTLVLLAMASWGENLLSISFLKLRQLTGTMSPAAYSQLSSICYELKKWDCVENAELSRFDMAKDVAILKGVADLQLRVGERDRAVELYGRYFELGGQDREAMISYAGLLEKQEKLESALQLYETALRLTPSNMLPARATVGIVRIMIKTKRYREAYDSITRFHATSENAKSYLKQELDWLKKQLSADKTVARR